MPVNFTYTYNSLCRVTGNTVRWISINSYTLLCLLPLLYTSGRQRILFFLRVGLSEFHFCSASVSVR